MYECELLYQYVQRELFFFGVFYALVLLTVRTVTLSTAPFTRVAYFGFHHKAPSSTADVLFPVFDVVSRVLVSLSPGGGRDVWLSLMSESVSSSSLLTDDWQTQSAFLEGVGMIEVGWAEGVGQRLTMDDCLRRGVDERTECIDQSVDLFISWFVD